MGIAGRFIVFAVLSLGLGACGSPDGSGAKESTSDASLNDSSYADTGPGSPGEAEAMADAPLPKADATRGDVDAGAGTDGAVGDAAALDSSRDSQGSVGPARDGGAVDGSTFVCGSVNPVTCAAATEYCTISATKGELPVRVNSCEALSALPCFSTNAGCRCNDIALDAGAGCRCMESDASSVLTIDCF